MSALISAGASLLGGVLGRKSEKKAIAAQNAYNHPSAIRARAEEAGFNPLLFIGPGVGQQTAVGGSNFMGSAIADAGMMLADKLAKRQDLRKLDAYKAQNQALQKQVNQMTLRPKVGGLYAQREAMPTRTAALGGVSARATANAGSGKAGSDVKTGAFDLSRNSPLAGAVVGAGDDNLTGPQLSVKKDVPAFRFLGYDFYGSGLFSAAQQVEDGVGESEIVSALWAPVAITDAFMNEAYKAGGRAGVRARGTGPVMSVGGQKWMMEKPRSKARSAANYSTVRHAGPLIGFK